MIFKYQNTQKRLTMILAKINKFIGTDGVEHLTTTWRLYKDKEKKILVDEKIDSENKELYFNTATIPSGTTYYLDYIRNYNINVADNNLRTIEIKGDPGEGGGLILNEDAIVESPTINFNMDDIKNKEYFTIETSNFRGNYGSHEFTHWLILDSLDNVLFSSIRDKENKTSITIANTEKIRSKITLKIIAVHGTLESVESKPAIFIINSNSINFEINTSLINTMPLKNFKIEFSKIDQLRPLGVINIEVIDSVNGDKLFTSGIEENSVVLPWYLFRPNSVVSLIINCYNAEGKIIRVIRNIKTSNAIGLLGEDKNLKYIKKVSKAYRSSIKIPNNISIEYLHNGGLYMPDVNDMTFIEYEYSDTEHDFKKTNRHIDGLVLENPNLEGLLIKRFNSDRLIIDSYNKKGVPTFYIYKYIQEYNKYVPLFNISREDEKKSIGLTNSLLQINTHLFLYVPYEGSYIKVLDINSRSVYNISSLDGYGHNTTLFRMADNVCGLIQQNMTNIIAYKWGTNKLANDVYLTPSSFTTEPIKSIHLNNGDALLFKCSIKNSMNDVMDSSILYHRLEDKKFINTGARFNHKFPTSIIKLSSGKIIFSRYDELENGVRYPRPNFGTTGGIQEGTEEDISSTYKNILLRGEIIESLDPNAKLLIVRSGDNKTVLDINIYDRIIIKEGGVLNWVREDGSSKIFTYKDCLITRNTVFDQHIFYQNPYETVTILDGVEVLFREKTPEVDIFKCILTPNTLAGELTEELENNNKILVVKENMEISDPSIYDKIIIRGKALLTWNNNGNKKVYSSLDCIITKTTKFSSELFKSLGYRSVTLLNSSNIEFLDIDSNKYSNVIIRPDSLSDPSYTIHYEFI